MYKKIFFTAIATLILSIVSFAQTQNATSDVMRTNGKIYVVMAVCITILVGLIIYLISLDRKVSTLEKEFKGEA